MREKSNLKIFRKLSFISGFTFPMPDNFENKSKVFRFFWWFYSCAPMALMLIELMSQAVQITISINNVEVLTTCTLSTLYIVQFILKTAVFKINEVKFNRIFEEMAAISTELFKNPFSDDRYIEFFDKYYKPVMNVGLGKGILQLTCNLGLNILFCVLSWIGMKPKITAAFSWTPYDSSKNPGYTLTCLFEMICYGAVTARTGVFDLLFWIMIIIPTVQLQYLKHLMGIMLQDTDDDRDEGDAADRDELKDKNTVETIEAKGTLSEEVLTLRLEWWMKTHQRILRMVQDFEGLASLFLAVNYIASLIDLFMSGFVAISSSHWDIFQRILINAIIITDAFQLYVISLAGDWLRESSQNVADGGFTTLLFKVKKEIRQNYLYILSRTRRLIQIRFGGINPLSSQTFLRLIQVTLTYFVTVIQIRNSQNEKSGSMNILQSM